MTTIEGRAPVIREIGGTITEEGSTMAMLLEGKGSRAAMNARELNPKTDRRIQRA